MRDFDMKIINIALAVVIAVVVVVIGVRVVMAKQAADELASEQITAEEAITAITIDPALEAGTESPEEATSYISIPGWSGRKSGNGTATNKGAAAANGYGDKAPAKTQSSSTGSQSSGKST